jgi:hypothetical protein
VLSLQMLLVKVLRRFVELVEDGFVAIGAQGGG